MPFLIFYRKASLMLLNIWNTGNFIIMTMWEVLRNYFQTVFYFAIFLAGHVKARSKKPISLYLSHLNKCL